MVLPSKPGVIHNIAMHASPTAMEFFLELVSTFLVHSPSFFQNYFLVFTMLAVANAGSCVSMQNKIGYLACFQRELTQVPVLGAHNIMCYYRQ